MAAGLGELRRILGPMTGVAICVGMAVGSGILRTPGDIAAGWILVQAARVNNRGAILGYAINPLRCPENNCNPYSFLLEPAD